MESQVSFYFSIYLGQRRLALCMSSSKLRRQIAFEAARLMYSRDVEEYYAAKQKAASRLYKGWIKPADLPSNAEIRDQVQMLARMHEGPDRHQQRLLQMRLRAAWWMEKLAVFIRN